MWLTKVTSDEEEEEPVVVTEGDNQLSEGAVKAEAHDSNIPARSSTELHVYSIEELQTFTKKGLLGDTTLLEGTGSVIIYDFLGLNIF